MELTHLKYFATLARLEHFTKAANELHISQPSLSKCISNLEDELGTRLFERDKKSVYLNDYGKAFLRHAQRILSDEEEALTELNDMLQGVSGDIRIASNFPLDAPSPLYYFTEEFFLQHPGIRIHCYQHNDETLQQMLLERKIDFVLTITALRFPFAQMTELYTSSVGVVLPRSHPLAQRCGPVSIYELADENFLCTNPLYNIRDSVYYLCHLAGFEPKVVFEGNSSEIVGHAISEGRGISLTSEEMFHHKLKNEPPAWTGGLVYLPIREEFCKRTISISYLKNRYHTAAARKFYAGLLDYFNIRDNPMTAQD